MRSVILDHRLFCQPLLRRRARRDAGAGDLPARSHSHDRHRAVARAITRYVRRRAALGREHVEVTAPKRERPAATLLDGLELHGAEDIAGLLVDLRNRRSEPSEVLRIQAVERVETPIAGAG